MNTTEVLEFTETQGYNPERRDSGRWILVVQDTAGREFTGFGAHVLRGEQASILLMQDAGSQEFPLPRIANVEWRRIPEWGTLADIVRIC